MSLIDSTLLIASYIERAIYCSSDATYLILLVDTYNIYDITHCNNYNNKMQVENNYCYKKS